MNLTKPIKTNNKENLQTAVVALIFFIAGKLMFFRLFALFEPTVAGIYFQITERPATIPTYWLFAIMMAVLVLLIKFIWRFGPVVSAIRRAGFVAVTAACLVAGVLLRHQQVKNYFIRVVRPFLQSKNQLPFNYPIDPANFVYYMFAGCCIGVIISFFLFRQKNKKYVR